MQSVRRVVHQSPPQERKTTDDYPIRAAKRAASGNRMVPVRQIKSRGDACTRQLRALLRLLPSRARSRPLEAGSPGTCRVRRCLAFALERPEPRHQSERDQHSCNYEILHKCHPERVFTYLYPDSYGCPEEEES